MIDNNETSRAQDKALNDAILQSNISFDFLPFIELCRRYYADEVDLILEQGPRRTIARHSLEGMLMDFLLPIHLIAEMGGVQVSVDARHIPSDCWPRMVLDTQSNGKLCGPGSQGEFISCGQGRRGKDNHA